MRILVVEDERKVAAFVRQGLVEEGHAVEVTADGEAALEAVAEGPPFDLVVLDVMLPRRGGLDVLRSLRALRVQTPVLLLTARDGVADKVAGLDAGADDYLTKPFGVRELVARARALLRRPRRAAVEARLTADASFEANGEGAQPIRIHGIEIDPARRRVRIEGRDVELTDQEFRLLHLLATHAGIVFSREALLTKIWRGDTYVTVRSVDTLVKRLRRRIETDPANPRFLLTVWGVGYKFADV